MARYTTRRDAEVRMSITICFTHYQMHSNFEVPKSVFTRIKGDVSQGLGHLVDDNGWITLDFGASVFTARACDVMAVRVFADDFDAED